MDINNLAIIKEIIGQMADFFCQKWPSILWICARLAAFSALIYRSWRGSIFPKGHLGVVAFKEEIYRDGELVLVRSVEVKPGLSQIVSLKVLLGLLKAFCIFIN